jgi:hypothetical protein
VRDPLKSITSIGCTEKLDWGNYTEFVRTNIPFDRGRFPPDGRLGVAMQMWVEMHEAIDRTGAPLWRLEDLVPTRFNKTKQLLLLEMAWQKVVYVQIQKLTWRQHLLNYN